MAKVRAGRRSSGGDRRFGIHEVAPTAVLMTPGPGRSFLELKTKQTVFWQGERADAVYYIQRGKVQLVVHSEQGKEAVIAILAAGDFFGEACVAGHAVYHVSAITMTPSTVVRIEREVMIRSIQEQPAISEAFMKYLLSRSVRIEADLIDQLFNSSERRLARVLLMLADFGANPGTEAVIPRISQETLAAKVGTTRSRINFFMNKFRKLGLVEYDNASETLKVHPALLTVIGHD